MAGGSTFTWGHALRIDSNKSPFSSPLPQTHKAFADITPTSYKRYNIAGLLTTVYGLDELPPYPDNVTAFWLLHGRGDTSDSMAFVAASLIAAWNSKRKSQTDKGLICIAFDQRNHGSRMIENDNNVSWKQGNRTHGQDMFSTYCGTAHDLSLLITQLPIYLPHVKVTDHMCGGVSLGGHATWLALMKDPRISAGMVIVGCPDYVRLMTGRAIGQKVRSAVSTDPPGAEFLGSPDFPQALLAVLDQYDPASVLMGELDVVTGDDHLHPPSDSEVARLRPIMHRTVAGKRIICLSGSKDKLVPYASSKPFLDWLKRAIAKDGWAHDQGLQLEDHVDPDHGHEFSKKMRKEAERWLCEVMSDDERTTSRDSKL